MKHRSYSFFTVFTLELFLGKEKVKKTKQDYNAPFSSFLVNIFIDIIYKLLLPSRTLRLHPRHEFVVIVITVPCYFVIFEEVQIHRVEESP